MICTGREWTGRRTREVDGARAQEIEEDREELGEGEREQGVHEADARAELGWAPGVSGVRCKELLTAIAPTVMLWAPHALFYPMN